MEEINNIQNDTLNINQNNAAGIVENGMNSTAPVNPYQMGNQINQVLGGRKIPEKIQLIRDNYDFFGMMAAVFALVYTFCLYRNSNGITAPVFTTALIVIMHISILRSQFAFKKSTVFYYVAIELLGIHLCTTMDGVIIFFDYAALVLLILSCLLHQMYDDSSWGLGRYVAALMQAVFGSLEYLPCPFSDLFKYIQKKKLEKNDGKAVNSNVKYVFLGILLGLPLLVVVLILLGSADIIFADMLGDMFESITMLEFIGDLILVPMMFLFGFVASYIVYCEVSSGNINTSEKVKPEHNPITAITLNAMLAVVYLIFSGIQILYLFIGNMTLPENYTYAEYARQGFFQLLAVCIINIVLVLICLYFFRNSMGLKIMLTVITACTYIMLASSMLRMIMYIEVYQLSYLRLLTIWMLIVLFLLMTGTVIYIYMSSFPLFRFSVIVVSVLYLTLAFAYPDRVIASYNLSSRFIDTEEGRRLIDYDYLEDRSVDAGPVIAEAIKTVDDQDFEDKFEWFKECHNNKYNEKKMTFRTFNFSRWIYEEEWMTYN